MINFPELMQVNVFGETPLFDCIRSNRSKQFEVCMQRMSNVAIQKPNNVGRTPLHVALNNGAYEMAATLLLRMNDDAINAIDFLKNSCLHNGLNRPSLPRRLCISIVDRMSIKAINHKNRSGETPFSLSQTFSQDIQNAIASKTKIKTLVEVWHSRSNVGQLQTLYRKIMSHLHTLLNRDCSSLIAKFIFPCDHS
jgi:hypothetical protein